MDILSAITSRIPATLLPEESVLLQLMDKWKVYLAPLMEPMIDEASAMLDASWPLLGAELIVNLVIYESLDLSIKSYILQSTGSSTATGGTTGIVKKVVTGPAEAEFFSPKETMSEVLKPGGLFSMTKDSICMLSSRLSINLYICEEQGGKVIAPKVHRTYNSKHHHHHSHTPSKNN